ncbi:hypothetical protein MADRUGA_26 [Mycobacterium phage Madruga]|uniref:Tail terminator n=1 Tax=Mycobacterium phage Madruga TaxID=1675552 RepID=A0A0K1LRW6_9CAUD|nr:hypothetical protein MADRUGA_26 [Mycobacterium phage Madruga]
MNPILLYDKLNAILPGRVYESQSLDSRPHNDGYFITVNMEELAISNSAISRGPRTVTVAVHHPRSGDADYAPITNYLNQIDSALLPIENEMGADNVRVSQVARGGRSGNLIDEGWNTITRNATYRVSYDEYAV